MILKDYLQSGLDVVFCGTAAGDRSAARGYFYAGPGNKFWRMLHETGLMPTRLLPPAWRPAGGQSSPGVIWRRMSRRGGLRGLNESCDGDGRTRERLI